jgi:hypothetical protein
MKRTVLLSALLLLLVALSGCSGGGIDFNTWAGSYSGTGTLDNGKTGALALTCDANGIVTGTLTVTGADGSDTDFKFTAGVYNVTGSITSTGGAFDVGGNVPSNGDFFIRGRFPTDSSSKQYTITTATSTTFPTQLTYTGSLTHD